jgi:HPt (histidine-containing phosphotransfer) domain-containing protein
MDGYLSKPIDAREMISLIESLARGAATGSPQPASTEPARQPAHEVLDLHAGLPAPDASVFSFEKAISHCFSRQEMFQAMVEFFFNDIEQLFPEMRSALETGDLVNVGELGHRLKGTVVFLGAHRATEAAARVEQFARSGGEMSEEEKAVSILEQECATLAQALAAYREVASTSND